jgi:hypothetical protein
MGTLSGFSVNMGSRQSRLQQLAVDDGLSPTHRHSVFESRVEPEAVNGSDRDLVG